MAIGRGHIDGVIDRAKPVADRLAAAGYRSYIVGGLVRDLHLGGGSSHDIDITTDALPTDVKAIVADVADDLWSQGERFGTIGLRIGVDEFEITTHRSEEYDQASRKPVVKFSTAIEADLSRRDFTVNAMALEISSGDLVDPFGGAADLAAGVLRTPGLPQQSFNDDPLRMLRAARFHAGYGLHPTAGLVSAMAELGDRISIVSQERIREETGKLLAVPRPGQGVLLLARTGLLELIVENYSGDDGDTIADLVDTVSRRPLVRLAAFYLLLLERGGLEAVRAQLSIRRHSTRTQQDVVAVLGAASHSVDDGFGVDDPNVRRFVAAAGNLVSEATEIAALDRLGGPELMGRFEQRLTDLARTESLDNVGPSLTGDQVMVTLGVGTGPVIGEALEFLMSLRIADGQRSADEERECLRAWWAGREDRQ